MCADRENTETEENQRVADFIPVALNRECRICVVSPDSTHQTVNWKIYRVTSKPNQILCHFIESSVGSGLP